MTVRAALAAIALLSIGVWMRMPETVSAQRARPPAARERATSALAEVDLATCAARAEWAGRRVRAGLVVLPDGEWGVTITSVQPELAGRDDGPLTQCIETALRARLGDRVPLPPREALVVTRDLELAGSAAVAAAVTARIDAARASFDACVREHADPRLASIEVAARVEAHGGRVSDVASRTDVDPYGAAARRCLGSVLTNADDLPEGAAVVRVTVTRPQAPPGTLARHDGSEGAICSWGERDTAELRGQYVLPEPSACRAGLGCCYGGGIPGLSSVCMRVDRRQGCPRYP